MSPGASAQATPQDELRMGRPAEGIMLVTARRLDPKRRMNAARAPFGGRLVTK